MSTPDQRRPRVRRRTWLAMLVLAILVFTLLHTELGIGFDLGLFEASAQADETSPLEPPTPIEPSSSPLVPLGLDEVEDVLAADPLPEVLLSDEATVTAFVSDADVLDLDRDCISLECMSRSISRSLGADTDVLASLHGNDDSNVLDDLIPGGPGMNGGGVAGGAGIPGGGGGAGGGGGGGGGGGSPTSTSPDGDSPTKTPPGLATGPNNPLANVPGSNPPQPPTLTDYPPPFEGLPTGPIATVPTATNPGPPESIPEPSTLALVAAGLAGLVARRAAKSRRSHEVTK